MRTLCATWATPTAMTEHYRQKTMAGIVEQLQNLVFFSGVSRESGKVS
jgi:hypothetical protein